MKNRKVKYWVVVKSNLDLVTALNVFDAQAIDGIQYDHLAIRNKYRIFDPTSITIAGIRNSETFNLDEIRSTDWEAIIPDDGREELLYKTRELVKDANFLRTTHGKIDNMSIFDIWNAIDDVVSMLDEQSQYRLIKHVIENKLYKKA